MGSVTHPRQGSHLGSERCRTEWKTYRAGTAAEKRPIKDEATEKIQKGVRNEMNRFDEG